MKAVILCGGKGTRIRDISEDMPKPMVPIGSKPIVEHIMGIYGRHNVNDFVLCLGYKGSKIKEYFANYRDAVLDFTIDLGRNGTVEYHDQRPLPPWRVTLADTGLEAMTGCRIKRIQRYIGNEPFMLTYGDGVADIDLNALLAFHRAHGKLVTLTAVRPPSRFGELVVEGQRVVDFQEKPQTMEGFINGGFFVCEPGAFDYVSDDEGCIWERDPLQRLAKDGQLMMYVHEGFWMPMDTAREFEYLNKLWHSGRAPWAPTESARPR
jgi:glucose-1-phosphate cytidylyltransferase